MVNRKDRLFNNSQKTIVGDRCYHYSHPLVGDRYFRVTDGDENVLQVVSKSVEKKGRPFCVGVTFIKYSTFISSWAWSKKKQKNIKKISEKMFNKKLSTIISLLRLNIVP